MPKKGGVGMELCVYVNIFLFRLKAITRHKSWTRYSSFAFFDDVAYFVALESHRNQAKN